MKYWWHLIFTIHIQIHEFSFCQDSCSASSLLLSLFCNFLLPNDTTLFVLCRCAYFQPSSTPAAHSSNQDQQCKDLDSPLQYSSDCPSSDWVNYSRTIKAAYKEFLIVYDAILIQHLCLTGASISKTDHQQEDLLFLYIYS